jgi:tetratricopeptide (TPR) repeat protein
VEPEERRARLEQSLGRGALGYYLNEVAMFGSIVGEMEEVERGFEEVTKINHSDDDWPNVSIDLRNLADAQILRGLLREAVKSASEALFYAGVEEAQPPFTAAHRLPKRPASVPSYDAAAEIDSRVYRAHALSLAGELPAASRDYSAADTIERGKHSENEALYSGRGINWCRHRLQLGDTGAARRLTERNRVICERNRWNANIAMCDLLLGELDLHAADRDSASRRIGEAVHVFREARQGEDLPNALLAQARRRKSVEDCEEALRLAARSGFVLMLCNALNLRALLRREAGELDKAAEDAHEVLEIAERCGYYWGRHEALRQLRDASKASGSRADEKHWEEAEQQLSKRMQPLIEEALGIEHAHDREMEKLYGKKKSTK